MIIYIIIYRIICIFISNIIFIEFRLSVINTVRSLEYDVLLLLHPLPFLRLVYGIDPLCEYQLPKHLNLGLRQSN